MELKIAGKGNLTREFSTVCYPNRCGRLMQTKCRFTCCKFLMKTLFVGIYRPKKIIDKKFFEHENSLCDCYSFPCFEQAVIYSSELPILFL